MKILAEDLQKKDIIQTQVHQSGMFSNSIKAFCPMLLYIIYKFTKKGALSCLQLILGFISVTYFCKF